MQLYADVYRTFGPCGTDPGKRLLGWDPEQGTKIHKCIKSRLKYRRKSEYEELRYPDIAALKEAVRGLQPHEGRSKEEPYVLETPDEAVWLDKETNTVRMKAVLTCDMWLQRCGNPHLNCFSTDTTFNTNSHGVNKKMIGWETQQKQRVDLAIAFGLTDTADDYYDARAQEMFRTP